MKKLFIVVLLFVGLLIPAVSATVIIDETPSEYADTSGKGKAIIGWAQYGSFNVNKLQINDIQRVQQLNYVVWTVSGNHATPGRYETTYTVGSKSGNAVIYKEHLKNFLGIVTHTRFTVLPDNWDVSGLSGPQTMTFADTIFTCPNIDDRIGSSSFTGDTPIWLWSGGHGNGPCISYDISVSCGISWSQRITVIDEDMYYIINLYRQGSGSTLKLHEENIIRYESYDVIDIKLYENKVGLIAVEIISPVGNSYLYPISDTTAPSNSTVTVYVQNSQNGALIANSHIDISAFVNGEFHEVVNETLPGGIYTGNLQPTGGGLPNPDYYRLFATAEGYNSIMPYIDFEHSSYTTIYAILDPIGGAPEDENNTFIDFYVRDINANPIAGATVKFGGYTLYTNSAGYTIFEVKKDNTYTWTVSKLGYGSVTGNAVIGSNARYTINAVIAPEVTPTTPTPKPSVTPVSPTPTLTAPTGEPVSNWLEWFAAHFGMILGGGVEIGKIFMWLCFTVPVGVYVGNKAKAGAAGFMAGAGIVTLFFVLIGWVPIWLVVLIALIIGLLYAKVYSNSDNGGGR